VRAVSVVSFSDTDPLSGLSLTDVPRPQAPENWRWVRVMAAGLNHHDLWTLRGVGLSADALPMILGCEAAGVDEETGDEVIIHSVVADPRATGDETTDPNRSLLSERHPGTFADFVSVPVRNLIPKPHWLTWQQAASLPVAWLTAYRMLQTKSGLQPGDTVLVQGAAGGVASAAIAIGKAAGYRVWATSRSEQRRDYAASLGADGVFEVGARLPERVDAVIETVGEATWAHSLKALKPGGTVVVSGATTGANPPADLARVFFLQLNIHGSTMGTLEEFHGLLELLQRTGLRPNIGMEVPLEQALQAFEAMHSGTLLGKAVLTLD